MNENVTVPCHTNTLLKEFRAGECSISVENLECHLSLLHFVTVSVICATTGKWSCFRLVLKIGFGVIRSDLINYEPDTEILTKLTIDTAAVKLSLLWRLM